MHLIAILLVVAIIGTMYRKGFAFKLGIVVSVLYWGLMIYAYSNQMATVPLSYAFMGGFVPLGIGALISIVFSF